MLHVVSGKYIFFHFFVLQSFFLRIFLYEIDPPQNNDQKCYSMDRNVKNEQILILEPDV